MKIWIVMAHGEDHGAYTSEQLAQNYINEFLEEGGGGREYDWDEDSFEIIETVLYDEKRMGPQY